MMFDSSSRMPLMSKVVVVLVMMVIVAACAARTAADGAHDSPSQLRIIVQPPPCLPTAPPRCPRGPRALVLRLSPASLRSPWRHPVGDHFLSLRPASPPSPSAAAGPVSRGGRL